MFLASVSDVSNNLFDTLFWSARERICSNVDAGGIKVLRPDTEIQQKRVPAFTDACASP